MVAVMRYAVVTQAWPARSLRSSAMTRMALATIVWSSAARNIPIMSPTRMVRISLWESTGRGSGPAPAGASAVASTRGGSAVVSDMSVLPGRLVGQATGPGGGGVGHRRQGGAPRAEVGVERVGELVQVGDERVRPGAVPGLEEPLKPRGPGGLDVVEHGVPLVGEGHDQGTPVVGVGRLGEQAAGDERAHLAAHGRHVVVQRRGEVGDPYRLRGPGHDEEDGVGRRVYCLVDAWRGVA